MKCAKCEKEGTHQVANYYLGEAKAKLGPHLTLCETHAKAWDEWHPFDTRAQKISGPKMTTRKKKHKWYHAPAVPGWRCERCDIAAPTRNDGACPGKNANSR